MIAPDEAVHSKNMAFAAIHVANFMVQAVLRAEAEVRDEVELRDKDPSLVLSEVSKSSRVLVGWECSSDWDAYGKPDANQALPLDVLPEEVSIDWSLGVRCSQHDRREG